MSWAGCGNILASQTAHSASLARSSRHTKPSLQVTHIHRHTCVHTHTLQERVIVRLVPYSRAVQACMIQPNIYYFSIYSFEMSCFKLGWYSQIYLFICVLHLLLNSLLNEIFKHVTVIQVTALRQATANLATFKMLVFGFQTLGSGSAECCK